MPPARRIAFLSPRFADGPTVGGAETLLRRLAERAAAAGREVTFLTTCAQDHFTWANVLPPGERKAGNITVRYFPVDSTRDVGAFLGVQNRISRFAPVTREDELVWLRNSVNSQALYEHLRTDGDRYDRVVMGPYLFGLVFFASRIHPEKTLLLPCLHDESFAYLGTIKEMFTAVRGHVFNTAPERDLAVRLYGIDPARSHVVGMGLDPFGADGERFRHKHRLAGPYVMYAGRREPLKGTPLLMDYLSVFRERTRQDVKLVLAGSGPVEPPPSLAPHVIDLGFVSETDKHDAMAGAIAFCHPSVNESLSIVILESWLARTPVLVHAGSAVMQYQCLQSNGGLWFRNYAEFEESLMLLMTHPDLRVSMAASGKAFVEREYAWPSVEARMLRALDT